VGPEAEARVDAEADVVDHLRSATCAIAAPQFDSVRASVGGKDKRSVEVDEAGEVCFVAAQGGPGPIPGKPGARGGARGTPELNTSRAIVGGEVDDSVDVGECVGKRSADAGSDVAYERGPTGGAVGTPEFDGMFRIVEGIVKEAVGEDRLREAAAASRVD